MNWYRGSTTPILFPYAYPLAAHSPARITAEINLIIGLEIWLSDPLGPQNPLQPPLGEYIAPPCVHSFVWRYHHNGGEPGFENEYMECVKCGDIRNKHYFELGEHRGFWKHRVENKLKEDSDRFSRELAVEELRAKPCASPIDLGTGHIDCQCWASGKFVWVVNCHDHPWRG